MVGTRTCVWEGTLGPVEPNPGGRYTSSTGLPIAISLGLLFFNGNLVGILNTPHKQLSDFPATASGFYIQKSARTTDTRTRSERWPYQLKDQKTREGQKSMPTTVASPKASSIQ